MLTARVDLLARPTLNFALLQAGVPIVQLVRVTNTGEERLEGASLVLRLQPDISPPVTLPVETLYSGESVNLDVVDLRVPPNRLRTVVEAEHAEIGWELRRGEDVLASGTHPIELLAWNEWPGGGAPPALLAVFTTPNHPAIAGVLRRVSDRLAVTTGNPSISGYQTRSPERVRAQLDALYETIQSFEIAYVGVPASFEACGQKVRLPDVVLQDRLGNCLDISLLFASCLEQMGMKPLVVIVPGHAFPGVWLVEEGFPEIVVNDAARLRTAIGLDQLVFFDSSTSIARPAVPFETARTVAHRALADDRLEWALDIRSARNDGWRPIPVRNAVDLEPAPELAPANPGPTTLVPDPGYPSGPVAVPSAVPADPLAARFARWKERLLDLSLRNKLLAFRMDVKTAIRLDVPDIGRFEDQLAGETLLELRPRPAKDVRDQRDAALVEVRADPAEIRERRLAELAKGIVQTDLGEADLMLHGIALERAAKTDLEEGGANTLFAAVGFLKWFEATQGGLPRLAPLLLVPVTLEVNRTARRVGVRRLPEDPVANFTLIEKLRRDFGVDLSAIGNLESDDSGVDVGALLRTARTAIARMDRWEVREDVALGQFVFGKFLLWKDLAENTAALLQNPVVRHIANRSATTFVNRVEKTRPEELDGRVRAADLALPIDADSTQMAAVHSALNGRSFVLQGPPGTGKSQTITNLIAASLAANKTVLFVAEKRAALEVVHRRLQQSGLADFCLELHSNKANKKEVLASLMSALERSGRTAEPPWASHSQKLEASRTELNQYPSALHRPREIGRSFYQVSGEVLSLKGVDRIPLSKSQVRSLTAEQLEQRTDIASRFSTAAANVEPVVDHPWRTSAVVGWSAALDSDVGEQLSTVLALHRKLEPAVIALATHLQVSPPDEPGRLRDLIALGARIGDGAVPNARYDATEWATWVTAVTTHADAIDAQRARREELATRWTERVYDLDLVRMESLFRSWSTGFFLFAWFALFFARRELGPVTRKPLGNVRIHTDLALAKTTRDHADALGRTTQKLVAELGGLWDGENGEGLRQLVERGERLRKAMQRVVAREAAVLRLVDPEAPSGPRERAAQLSVAAEQAWSACREAWARLAERLVTPVFPEDEPFAARERQARDWEGALSRLRYWGLYLERAEEMRAVGLGPVADAHREGRLAAAQVERVTRHSLLAPWVEAIRDEEPVLRSFEGTEHHRRVERFRALDQQHQKLAGQVVVHRLEQRLPNGASKAAESSEPGILLRESKKKTRQKPIRKLLLEIPNLLPKLKPCLLMSPLSVAQYLPAEGRKFDLVVFDEASQIGTHDAIGALARGNQVVVVGDSRQLPPTTFFQRAGDDGATDENDFEELESILDEAVASGLPEELLGWHYRSRHEALIQFSNAHFYGNRLNVFPAARGKVEDLGVSWHHVQGVYDKGTSRTNRKEADALVANLVGSLLATKPGVRTFGVVTFSQAQQMLVSDLIDEQRRAHPELEGHFGGIDEPVFVKNLENVQGDERDEILFSIAYGPDEHGKVAMNFGPLNREGGERRLNVAVTRARLQLRVFSSLTADQIDLNRTKATGPRHLQEFLRYAQASGSRSPEGTNSKGDFDSDFEREVYDVLVTGGYEVHCQVGCRGYKIDLAVVHPEKPGEYVLAIEADGAAYHSGATARDRDRLRQQVLEGLGWKVHRIWSTDWWYERQREIDRLMKAVSDAIRNTEVVPVPVELTLVERKPEPVRLQQATVPVDVYASARPVPVSTDPEALYDRRFQGELGRVIAEVLRLEAPVHVDVLSRRVAAAFGASKATARLRTRVLEVARTTPPGIVLRDAFVWLPGVEPARWSRVRIGGSEPRDADEIPPEELAAAAAQVLADSLSLPEEVLIRETARRVGIQRVGKKVAEVMAAAVELLITRGGARREGAQIVQVASA